MNGYVSCAEEPQQREDRNRHRPTHRFLPFLSLLVAVAPVTRLDTVAPIYLLVAGCSRNPSQANVEPLEALLPARAHQRGLGAWDPPPSSHPRATVQAPFQWRGKLGSLGAGLLLQRGDHEEVPTPSGEILECLA